MKTLLIEADDIVRHAHRIRCACALMVMPCTDLPQARRAQGFAATRSGLYAQQSDECLLLAVHDRHRMGFAAVVNQVFDHSQSRWIGYMAQDAFAGRDWLARGLHALQSRQAGLLAFNDGKWHGQLASFGLAERAWVRSVYGGGMFYPGYHSHYGDVELTLIARQQNRYAYDADSVLMEVDWSKEQTSVRAQDRQLFRARAQGGFDGRVSEPQLLELFG